MRLVLSVLVVALATVVLMSSSLIQASDPPSERGVTGEVKWLEVIGMDLATTIKPPERPTLPHIRPPFWPDTTWLLIDSLDVWKLVPGDDRWGVHFDLETQSLEEVPLSYSVEDSAVLAVEASPVWVQRELYDNFRMLSSYYQKTYARKILVADPVYRDEIAFQVAHLSPQTLTDPVFSPDLVDTNVVQLYRLDADLQFVDIVEYGDPYTGDCYTTTKYRVIDELGDTIWAEIPKEIYYWWVMMPKLSDETPRMDSYVYNRFWRDYLYNSADPTYPLLKDVLQNLTVFWDGLYHVWPGGRTFSDTMLAVDAIGNWVSETVPYPASGNRPIQPNVIAHEHNGNCGELQDLLNAAARTALLPVLSVSNWPEDHVWNEVYHWEGNWYEYQVDLGHGSTHIRDSTTAYDPGKHCSVIFGWKGSGYTWSETDRYTPCCSLTVRVRDAQGRPVDGAEVVLASRYYADPSYIIIAHWTHTDANGELTVAIGDSNDFFARVDCPIGHYPSSPTQVTQIITNSQPGAHYYWTRNLSGSMPEIAVTETTATPMDHYKLRIEYDLPYRTVYGGSYWEYSFSADDHEYTEPREPGAIDFFICDAEDYDDYISSTSFFAYEVTEDLSSDQFDFILPAEDDFYAVFSNDEKLVVSAGMDATVRLYRILLRGDANGDGVIDIGDVVYLINYLLTGTSAPHPLWVGDCNCDEIVDIGDVIYLINYLFTGTSPPGC